MEPAIKVILDLLEQDTTLCDRTLLSVQNIIELLGFCLHNIYFSFQNKSHEQVEGAAMGSLVSPMVAKLYMEHFGKKALSTTSAPRLWMRYLNDTFGIQQEWQKQTLLEHINKVDPAIKFTVEDNQENDTIPLHDTLVKPETDNTPLITVYRKPSHTDQYLQWDSHHNLGAKSAP